jgi:hypothetical protein
MGGVNTGALLLCGATCNTTTIVGQGLRPILWALLNKGNPGWTDRDRFWDDITDKVRDFSSARGKDSELSEIAAGTASVTLDNRDNDFEPSVHADVHPMNELWLLEQFDGQTNSMIKGHVESYEYVWPAPGHSEALAIASIADELKILNLSKLPPMNPSTADSYESVVQFDQPSGYWRWSEYSLAQTAIVDGRTSISFGNGWRVPNAGGGYGISNGTPIIGDVYGSTEDGSGGSLSMSATQILEVTDTSAGDLLSGTAATVELWFLRQGTPGSNTQFWAGPDSISAPGTRIWSWALNTGGTVTFTYLDSTGTNKAVTSTAALVVDDWYHLVATIDGSNVTLYVNGVLSAATAATNLIAQADTDPPMKIQYPNATVRLDEMAIYPSRDLSAERIQAHYSAGTARGYDQQQPGERIGALLDTVENHAPRSLQLGSIGRTMYPRFMADQGLLGPIQQAVAVEKPDGLFFAANDGTLTFLSAAHRSSPPYSTVQIIFSDDGTSVPYLDFSAAQADSFLGNKWNVSKSGRGAVMQTVFDQTSIDTYFEQSQSITDLSVTLNSVCATIASAYLAKYKEPMQRGQNLVLTTDDTAVTDVIFQYDLGTKVRVIRTRPGGGTFDQNFYIQKIDITGGNDQKPWSITLGVSPL